MDAAVHVAADREPYVALIRKPEDADRIFLVKIPRIHILCLREAEDSCKGSGLDRVCPEHILLDKCDMVGAAVGQVADVAVRDPEDDPCLVQHSSALRIENLVGRPLKIQHEDTAVRKSEPVIFMHVEDLCGSVLRVGGNAVIHRQGRRIFIDLRQHRGGLIEDLRMEIRPGQLIDAVVNVHIGQRLLDIRRGIRLNRRADRIQVRPVDALVPEACGKIQIIGGVKTVRQKYMGIVVDIPAAGRHLNAHDILFVHEHAPLQLQVRGQVIPVLAELDHLRVLKGLGPVDGKNLIGHRIHCRAEGLDAQRDAAVAGQRRNGLADLAHVHLPAVAVQAVKIRPVLIHVNQREG